MFRRKNKEKSNASTSQLKNESIIHQAASLRKLEGAEQAIKRMIFIPRYKIIVAACWDERVRVYDVDSPGKPRAVFEAHTNAVQGVAHVVKDVAASVGDDGYLYTWRATTTDAQQLGALEIDTFNELTSVAKIDANRLIVGTSIGTLVIVSHENGTKLKVVRRIEEKHSKQIHDITEDSIWVISCSGDRNAIVWDAQTLNLVTTLRHDAPVRAAAISNRRIITACSDGKVYVYKNTSGFPLSKIFITGASTLHSISIVNDDVLTLMGTHGLVSFVSISKKIYFAHSQLPCEMLYTHVVLGDGRIAAGGTEQFCGIFKPPNQVQETIEKCASTMYLSSNSSSGSAKSAIITMNNFPNSPQSQL